VGGDVALGLTLPDGVAVLVEVLHQAAHDELEADLAAVHLLESPTHRLGTPAPDAVRVRELGHPYQWHGSAFAVGPLVVSGPAAAVTALGQPTGQAPPSRRRFLAKCAGRDLNRSQRFLLASLRGLPLAGLKSRDRICGSRVARGKMRRPGFEPGP
jgi:hypothetical protein